MKHCGNCKYMTESKDSEFCSNCQSYSKWKAPDLIEILMTPHDIEELRDLLTEMQSEYEDPDCIKFLSHILQEVIKEVDEY